MWRTSRRWRCYVKLCSLHSSNTGIPTLSFNLILGSQVCLAQQFLKRQNILVGLNFNDCYLQQVWRNLNTLLNAREEAASVVMSRNRMYIMGGLIDKEPSRNTEVLSSIDGAWEDGFSLPERKSSPLIYFVSTLILFISIRI